MLATAPVTGKDDDDAEAMDAFEKLRDEGDDTLECSSIVPTELLTPKLSGGAGLQ